VTTEQDRRGALEAVERIVNRGGEDVLGETLAALRRLYPTIEVRDGAFELAAASDDDRRLLDRVGVLVSHFTAENAKRFQRP
jgi:hypothetical protein